MNITLVEVAEYEYDVDEEIMLYPKQTVTDLLPCAFYSFDIYSQ